MDIVQEIRTRLDKLEAKAEWNYRMNKAFMSYLKNSKKLSKEQLINMIDEHMVLVGEKKDE